MHIPVLLDEVSQGLKLRPGSLVIDATVGGGGHSEAILKRIGSRGKLLGLDADETSLGRLRKRLTNYQNAHFVHAWLDSLETVAEGSGFSQVDAILFDLGFSSLQLDDPLRGFSFQADGPLDMRFDLSQPFSARELVNQESERQLADIFYRYGELYGARSLARKVVAERRKSPIERTGQLVTILGLSNPGVKAKVFQSLRIAVNDELGRLERAIPQAVSLLRPGGRLAVISFHSLEDRLVKLQFRANHLLKVVTKKPITPRGAEIAANPRSRSAKLRVAEKLQDH